MKKVAQLMNSTGNCPLKTHLSVPFKLAPSVSSFFTFTLMLLQARRSDAVPLSIIHLKDDFLISV